VTPFRATGSAAYTQIVGPPTRPEPTAEEREAAIKADRITYSAVLKRFRWDAATYELAQRHGFPARIDFDYGKDAFGYAVRREAVFSLTAIMTWLDDLCLLAKTRR
jgi:hypothetical protein